MGTESGVYFRLVPEACTLVGLAVWDRVGAGKNVLPLPRMFRAGRC